MSSTITRQPNEADKLKSAAEQAGQSARDAANTVGQKTQDLANAVGQRAQEFVQAGEQKVKDAVQTAGQKVQETAQTVGHKAEDATAALGTSMQTAAGKVRQTLPHEGVLGHASEAVAGALERGGHYIEEKNIRGMADDITEVIKKNPIPAVLIAAGLGFLLGRTLRS